VEKSLEESIQAPVRTQTLEKLHATVLTANRPRLLKL
jgi:hypothetical protein